MNWETNTGSSSTAPFCCPPSAPTRVSRTTPSNGSADGLSSKIETGANRPATTFPPNPQSTCFTSNWADAGPAAAARAAAAISTAAVGRAAAGRRADIGGAVGRRGRGG